MKHFIPCLNPHRILRLLVFPLSKRGTVPIRFNFNKVEIGAAQVAIDKIKTWAEGDFGNLPLPLFGKEGDRASVARRNGVKGFTPLETLVGNLRLCCPDEES